MKQKVPKYAQGLARCLKDSYGALKTNKKDLAEKTYNFAIMKMTKIIQSNLSPEKKEEYATYFARYRNSIKKNPLISQLMIGKRLMAQGELCYKTNLEQIAQENKFGKEVTANELNMIHCNPKKKATLRDALLNYNENIPENNLDTNIYIQDKEHQPSKEAREQTEKLLQKQNNMNSYTSKLKEIKKLRNQTEELLEKQKRKEINSHTYKLRFPSKKSKNVAKLYSEKLKEFFKKPTFKEIGKDIVEFLEKTKNSKIQAEKCRVLKPTENFPIDPKNLTPKTYWRYY
jgi:hypothetical protein